MLEVLVEMFPQSQIFTLFHEPGSVSEIIESRKIHTSFLNSIPFRKKLYRYTLPLMPYAIEKFKIHNDFDFVFSISHSFAKGIKTNLPHISYINTPMRYIWEMYDEYFKGFSRIFMNFIKGYLKEWDIKSNKSITFMIANSTAVKERIKKHYGVDAAVINPPVDVEFFKPVAGKEEFFLLVSAFVPYKKIDMAVEAFNILGKKLLIIGEGPLYKRIKKLAKKNIEFLPWQEKETLRLYYSKALALIHPQIEDFGIVPVEANACGTPVIAYARGGILDSQNENTAVFFHSQTPSAIVSAVKEFENRTFSRDILVSNAKRFSKDVFKKNILNVVNSILARSG